MKLIILGALIAFLSAFRPARADDACAPDLPTGRALDLEFAAAQEGWIASFNWQLATGNWQLLIDRLDADRYADRAKAGAKLTAVCATDPSAARWLLRARSVERRPEVRYWLNRTLRAVYRCETCDGFGYCTEYRAVASEQPAFTGIPCRRCGRTEWQHGLQWTPDGRYEHLACADCHGFGTHWTHYAVD